MTPTEMALAADFPAHDLGEWRDLVAAVLNKTRADDAKLDGGQAEAVLRSTLPGDLTVDPLYLRPAQSRPLGSPGAMPFTRGRALRDAGTSWDVRAFHDDPDVDVTREAVLADLEHGVTSVWLQVGTDGLRAGNLDHALAEVKLDLAPVVVSSFDDQAEAARALLDILERDAAARGNLGLDPLGASARTGSAPDLSSLADYVRETAGLSGRITAITVDSRVHRDAGATAVQEIAYAVATGIAYLRHLAEAGIEAAAAFPQIEFRVSASADQFLTIAALRALRRLWARVGEVLDVPEADRGARIHAVTSLRMFTRNDPWVNVLRSTIATFAASVGGADAITVLPYDTVMGLPEKFSRRLARNTQIVLADESNIARVTDPAGGSWYVESLTDDVAQTAWAIVQEIEGKGGMATALADGHVAQQISESRSSEDVQIATRRAPITGVSMFPLAGEQPLSRKERIPLARGPKALVPQRDAQVFEDLRDRAAAADPAPTVIIAALGTRRDFGAREMFVANLLAAGGITAETLEGTPGEIAAEAGSRHTSVVVLASSPKGYAAQGADAIAALREQQVDQVLVAGRKTELGDAAGEVDGEVRDGMDVVAFLDDLLTRLGAPAEGDER